MRPNTQHVTAKPANNEAVPLCEHFLNVWFFFGCIIESSIKIVKIYEFKLLLSTRSKKTFYILMLANTG